jgi:HK97 family phage prohead protease
MTETEIRTYRHALTLGEVEVEGRPGRLTEMHGRAVPYDTWAQIGMFYMERHAGNSFKRSTDGAAKGLPLLMFHDHRSFPIGVSTAWEHSDALYGSWRLNDSPESQRSASAARDGELTGLSVGFLPSRSQWDHVDDWDPDLGPDHMDRVTHTESRLAEVSLTPTPAFTDAEVLLVRTAVRRRERSTREVDAWRRRIEALRR